MILSAKDNIYKRLKKIDTMISNGFKRMLKNNNETEDEIWTQTHYELRREKEDLLEQLAGRVDFSLPTHFG